MQQQGGEAAGPAWVVGEMILRVNGTDREADRVVHVPRPYGLIGQAADSDVRIDDPAVNPRHVYLHLDARGVYVVDLVTRSGTRIDGTNQMVGWLQPGQSLEVAGRRIELVRIRIEDDFIEPPPCNDELLEDGAATSPLVSLTLEPRRSQGGPWEVGSELIFLGWSNCCGIQLRDAAAAKIHCAFFRTADAAYLVDLCGHHTWIDDRPVARGAAIINDGASLTIGSTPFAAHVTPPPTRTTTLARLADPRLPTNLVARVIDPVDEPDEAEHADLLPAGPQHAVLGWMMEVVRESQGSILRQQGEMQASLVQLLRQLQQDHATLLNAHLARVEKIDGELEALREELARRTGPDASTALPPAPPQAAPLRVARRAAEPTGPKAPTAWLLERVSQLEAENQSAWKDLFQRLSSSPRGSR